MTEHQDNQPAPDTLGDPTRKVGHPNLGRRFLLTAAAPVVVTLANRSALAGDKKGGGGWSQICSPSAQMSVNLSNVVSKPGTYNCGVSPYCWKTTALNYYNGQSLWDLTGGFEPGSNLSSTFTLPSPTRWKLEGTLREALSSSATGIKYKPSGSSSYQAIPSSTIQHLIAALLNAAAWGASGHFPATAAVVKSQINAIFTQHNSSAVSLTTASGTAASVATAYVSFNGNDGSDPCGAYL